MRRRPWCPAALIQRNIGGDPRVEALRRKQPPASRPFRAHGVALGDLLCRGPCFLEAFGKGLLPLRSAPLLMGKAHDPCSIIARCSVHRRLASWRQLAAALASPHGAGGDADAVQGDGAGGFRNYPAGPFRFVKSSQLHKFKISILIDHGDIMRPKQFVERLGDERLNILAGLRLHKPQAALEIGMQISPDLAGSGSRCRSRADRRQGHRRSQGEDPRHGTFHLRARRDRLGFGGDLPGHRQARRGERGAHPSRAAKGLGRQPARPIGPDS